MKVQIKVRPSGAYNGAAWPAAGEVIDLPDIVAEGMLASGDVVHPEAKTKTDPGMATPAKPKATRTRKTKVETAVTPSTTVETAAVVTTPAPATE